MDKNIEVRVHGAIEAVTHDCNSSRQSHAPPEGEHGFRARSTLGFSRQACQIKAAERPRRERSQIAAHRSLGIAIPNFDAAPWPETKGGDAIVLARVGVGRAPRQAARHERSSDRRSSFHPIAMKIAPAILSEQQSGLFRFD